MKKSILFATLLTLLLGGARSKAQVDANVEAIKSFKPEKSYIRSNMFYKLPLDIKGYTFMEFYPDESNFGKTTISKDVVDKVGIMSQAVHGTGFDDMYGLGIKTELPMPEKGFAEVYIAPVWIDSKGKHVENRNVAGYFATISLPLDLQLSSFGEVNLAGPSRVEWNYGEISIEKPIDKHLSIAYNPALQPEGGLVPSLEHRVTAKYTF